MFFFSVCSEGGRKRKRGGGEDRPGKGWEEGDWQDSEVVSPVQGRETTEKLISALPPQFATLLLTLRRPLPSMPCPLQRTPPSPPPSSASGESRHAVWMSRELRATGGAWITLCTHGEINQPQNELKTRIFYTVNFPVEEDVCPITADEKGLMFFIFHEPGSMERLCHQNLGVMNLEMMSEGRTRLWNCMLIGYDSKVVSQWP